MEEIPTLTLLSAADYSLDDKGRISLPADFRHRVSHGGLGPFVVTYGAGRSLSVFSTKEWEAVLHDLQIPPESEDGEDEDYEDYLRWVMTGTSFLMADAQGRVRIPANLLEHAGLTGTVTIFGMFNRLELWDPKELKNRFGSDPSKFKKQHSKTLRSSTYKTIGARTGSRLQTSDGMAPPPAEG